MMTIIIMHNFVKFLFEGSLGGTIFFGEPQMAKFIWCKLTPLIMPNLKKIEKTKDRQTKTSMCLKRVCPGYSPSLKCGEKIVWK